MAIAVKDYEHEALPPGESTQKAVEALNFIAGLELPASGPTASPESEAFFYEQQLGMVLGAVVEDLGAASIRTAGYPQLSGSDGQERFYARLYPEKRYGEDDQQVRPAAFHAYITPVAPFNEQDYTIPITIPFDSGRPRVQKNTRANKYGGTRLGEPMSPRDSLEQVKRLAVLMARALRGPEAEPGVYERR